MHFDWNIDYFQISCHCDAFDKSCFTEGKTMFHNLNLSFLFSDSYKLKRRSKELLMILNFYIYYFKKIKTCHCDIYDWQRAYFQNILSILSWRTILCFQATFNDIAALQKENKVRGTILSSILTTWPLRHNDIFHLPANCTRPLRSKELT